MPLTPHRLARTSGIKNLFLKPIRFLYVFLSLGALFLLYQLLWGSFWSFKNIVCTIDTQPCPEEIMSQTLFLKGQKLITFKPTPAIDKLKKTNPGFDTITFQIFYPDKLNIKIQTQKDLIKTGLIKFDPPKELLASQPSSPSAEATPSASPHSFLSHLPLLNKPTFDEFSLTSQGELITIPNSNQRNQAFILVENSLPITENLRNFYLLYQELKLSGFSIRHFWVHNSSAGLELEKGNLVVFDLNTDPRQSVASLQQIRSESTINFDQSIIDLRFTNPVVSKINDTDPK